MTYRPLLIGLVAMALAGCELLPEFAAPRAPTEPEVFSVEGCGGELPGFVDETCLLEDWIAFGLASQRGDREWREATLADLEGGLAEQRLARAVALAWGTERQWDQAAEIFRTELHTAPVALQPLLRYWLNELEGRRGLAGRLERSRETQASLERQRADLEANNAELRDKLEALTAIEQSINLRQQSD